MKTFFVLVLLATSLPAETLRRCIPPVGAPSEEWTALLVVYPFSDLDANLTVSPDCEISFHPANIDPYRLYAALWEVLFMEQRSKAPNLRKMGTSPRQAILVLIRNWLEGQENLKLSEEQLGLLRFAPYRTGHCTIYESMTWAAECDIQEKK